MLRDFLNPIIKLLNETQKSFNEDGFTMSGSGIQLYSTTMIYKVDFFPREKWKELISSDVGEYFLSTFPVIENQLASFEKLVDDFDASLSGLNKSIEESPVFLKLLIDTYERMISHERILRSQFEYSSLQQIAVYLLGQLGLQISNHRAESEEHLVRFTAYSLLELKINYPQHAVPEDYKLLAFCRDITKGLGERDGTISKSLKEAKRLFGAIASESMALWRQLKAARMNIATQYKATFEQ